MKPSYTMVEKAILFATKAHAGIKRKGSNIPYILHPLEAASIVAAITDSEEVIAASILHDVLEDTPVKYHELGMEFGKHVADLVKSTTEDKRVGESLKETWDIRKQEKITFLNKEANIEEKVIALGDSLSNIRSMHKDSIILGDELWEKFNQKDKAKQGWYYGEILQALRELKNYPAWKEMRYLNRAVFPD